MTPSKEYKHPKCNLSAMAQPTRKLLPYWATRLTWPSTSSMLMLPSEQAGPRGVGIDGNIYSLGGKAGSALRKAGHGDMATEMYSRITETGSYAEALAVIMSYVEAS